jgi:hypothetical protein
VLCYSRLMFIEFTLSQRKAEFYRGIVHALEFFGGSPGAIIFDNLKAAVINGSGRAACFHPEFLALCGYFCLQPIACQRRDPESKGIIEGNVRYVKHNALAGRADELIRFEDYQVFGNRPAEYTWLISRCRRAACFARPRIRGRSTAGRIPLGPQPRLTARSLPMTSAVTPPASSPMLPVRSSTDPAATL